VPGWEYRVITMNTEYEVPFEGDVKESPESSEIVQNHLNEMGEDGWELVSFLPALPTAQNWKGTMANPWIQTPNGPVREYANENPAPVSH
jgi:Domain of unknown function (DUF4177)